MSKNIKNKLVNCSFWLIISLAASVLLIWCAERAYHGFNAKHIIAIELVVFIALVIHIWKSSQEPYSVAASLGLSKPKAGYDIRYDYIRLFAVFAVILMHSIDNAMPFLSSEINEDTLAVINSVPKGILYPAAILRTLFYLGNTCFLMLTGALTFGRKADEDLFGFYKHFFSRILLPFIIYFIFYMWQNGELNPLNYDTISAAVHKIATGDIGDDAPFLWLIYMTVSIYMSIPFLRYMFNAMSYRMLTMFAAVILICYTLRIYFTCTPDILPFFSNWIGVSIIGLWMTREETRAYDKYIWIAAAFALIKTCLAVNPYVYWQHYINFYVHFAPLSIFMACGVFALALHRKPAKTHRFDTVIIMLSRNSYTMLLLHWWALYHVLIRAWDNSLSWEHPLNFAISVLLIILISLVSGFLIDQTLIFTIRYICDNILECIHKSLRR